MKIRQLDPESFVHAYNVDLQLLYPWDGVVSPPFGAAWAVLAPGESTKPHAHQEFESFFIAKGNGQMAVGEERMPVTAGDVTFHRPFDSHVLTNDSDDNLLFLTVWWEETEAWQGEVSAPAAEPWPGVHRVLVTAAPPTPNGDLHLGHLAGPYLGADVYARALRLFGVEAHFACGTDDNSIYVEAIGEQLGLSADAAADRFAAAITESLELAGVDLAIFPRPNASPYHREETRRLFRALYDRGELVERESPQPYCEGCDRYLFESGILGRCPHCSGGVMGNTCEDCGRINDAADLVDATCSGCGEPPGRRTVRRLVFPLARHADRLRDYHRGVSMSSHLRALCESVLDDGAPEVAVTHPVSWGVEVPVAGFEDQRIYVWLEMAARYLAYARSLEERLAAEPSPESGGWDRWWKSDDAAAVQFFGYDNSFYYGLLIPALLGAYDPGIRLPRAFVTNEFYRLDGEKFSTSRDHRILGRDLLAPAAGPALPSDALRYALAATAPERSQTNFTLAGMRRRCEEELLGRWQGWLADLGRRLAAGCGGEVPATGDWTSEHRTFFRRLEEIAAQAEASYAAERFSPQRAAGTMSELVREARRFAAGEVHWEGVATRGEERRTAFALELLAAKLLGLVAAPVMPGFAERLWRQIGYPAGPAAGDWAEALQWVPPGQQTAGLGEPLWPGLAEYLAGDDSAERPVPPAAAAAAG